MHLEIHEAAMHGTPLLCPGATALPHCFKSHREAGKQHGCSAPWNLRRPNKMCPVRCQRSGQVLASYVYAATYAMQFIQGKQPDRENLAKATARYFNGLHRVSFDGTDQQASPQHPWIQ